MSLLTKPILALAVGLLLSGCQSAVKPQAPEARQLKPAAQWQQAQQWLATSATPIASLVEQVSDQRLQQLIAKALANNLSLAQTAARLQQSYWRLGVSQKQGLPKLDLNLQSSDAKSTASSSQLALQLSWELDVWGRLADQAQAAQQGTLAQALDYRAAQNSLAAQVVQQWLALALNAQLQQLTQSRLASLEHTEQAIKERFVRGLGNLADLQAASAASARALDQQVALQQSRLESELQLRLLLAELPSSELELPQQLPSVAFPSIDLPAQVMAARVDLQAAYLRILEADSSTQASYKALLPGLRLSGSTSQSGRLSELLSATSAWQLLLQLSAPLLDGGQRRADLAISQLAAEQAFLSYRQTLLKATQEVEQALAQERALAQRQQHLSQALQHGEANLAQYQQRYAEGLGDILTLLSAQQQVYDDRIALVQVEQARLSNRISLALALGINAFDPAIQPISALESNSHENHN